MHSLLPSCLQQHWHSVPHFPFGPSLEPLRFIVLMQLDSCGVRMDFAIFEMPQMFLCVYTVFLRQQSKPVILDLLKDVSPFWAPTGSEFYDKVAGTMGLLMGI